MTYQQDRAIELTYYRLEGLAVTAAETAQRVRRSDDLYAFVEESFIEPAKAGRVSERAVDEHNVGISHSSHLAPDQMSSQRAALPRPARYQTERDDMRNTFVINVQVPARYTALPYVIFLAAASGDA